MRLRGVCGGDADSESRGDTESAERERTQGRARGRAPAPLPSPGPPSSASSCRGKAAPSLVTSARWATVPSCTGGREVKGNLEPACPSSAFCLVN